MFDATRCNECGDCFTRCRYIDYSRDKAVSQIRALKQGAQADILRDCITCVACNEYCAAGAKPFDLICARQEETGIRFVDQGVADFIDETLSRVPNEISAGDPEKPAVSLCVMGHAYPPDMADSALFRGLTLVRGSDYYSRIVHLHNGFESRVRQHAQQFVDNFSRLGKEEVVFVHDDCYTLAAVKAPEYGITVPFRPVHIFEYMVRYLKEHADQVVPLNKKIAYQRPCISRYTPEKEPFADEFFQLIGAERVARQYDRCDALCCAFGLLEVHPEKGSEVIERNISDAKNHGADAMTFLCPGCYWLLSGQCEDRGLASMFIIDLCRMALGELPFASRPWKGTDY